MSGGERERERARFQFFEKEKPTKERQEKGFGVGNHWLNPPPPFMDSTFSFSAQNFLV